MAPPLASLESMQRAKTTLEDFVSSYFMFHGLDASQPTDVFKHLPLLMFVEAYIYQLDQENEDQVGKIVNQAQEVDDQKKGASSDQQQQLKWTDSNQVGHEKQLEPDTGLSGEKTGSCSKQRKVENEVSNDMICSANGGKRKSADGSLLTEPHFCEQQTSRMKLRKNGKSGTISKGEGKDTGVADTEREKEQACSSGTGQTGQAALLARTAFAELSEVLQTEKLLTPRIVKELSDGLEFWQLERQLCQALAQGQEVKRAEVERAVALKSFDYRVLNLLLYELEGRPVNEQHFEFLRVSELLVEISDDLFDYEDDVLHNTFNVYRCFLAMFGLTKGQLEIAQWISSIERQYEKLLSTLEPGLAERYRERCRSAAKEGGSKLSAGSPMGNWSLPPPIIDERAYVDEMKTHMLVAEGGPHAMV